MMRYRRARALVVHTLGAAVLLLLLAACSGLPLLSQSASQLAEGAFQSWELGGAVQFKGSLSVKEGTVRFKVTESLNPLDGTAKGTGTLAGKPFAYLAAPSHQCVSVNDACQFLKGQSFWQEYYNDNQDQQTTAKGFGAQWVLVRGSNDVLDALRNLTLVGGLLQCDACSFEKGGTRIIDGQQATQVTSGGRTFWVAQGNPDRLVGFQATAANVGTIDGQLHNVDITMASVKAPHGSAPAQGQFVNPDDPPTLPARYQVDSEATEDLGACGANSCMVQVGIRNEDGAPQGTGTVQITAQDPHTNANIASCTANIPAIPSDQDELVSCTINGAAWTAWAKNAANADGGSALVVGTARITANPPYFE